MSTANTTLRVTELDFDSIRFNLKEYLRSQDKFKDFDFDGSGMSVLLDILAYNTHYMGYYVNMVGNEMFLDTAQLRGSIISHAKSIGYVPNSRRGAETEVTIQVTPSPTEDQISTILALDKYSKFLSQVSDGTFRQFVAVDGKTASKVNGVFSFANVTLKQGEVITQQVIMDPTNDKRLFEIPSANVDLSTLMVSVQESASNTDTILYVPYTDITLLNSNTAVYFVEENDKQTYNLYFGDGVIGRRPKNGNIITLTYLDTTGSLANNISNFLPVDRIGGKYRDNVIVTAAFASYGGTEKESIEQVRFRAPYYYATQNRAVTVKDYETLLLSDYPYLDSVSIWGGESNDPVVYGKVFMALKTRQNYALSNAEKENIKKNLIETRNVLTVTPEIIDPEYVYIRVLGKVKYDSRITSLTVTQILELAKAAIFDYSDQELDTFSSTFRKSKLQHKIETAEKSITGSDIDILVDKRVIINSNNRIGYQVRFNMPLQKGNFVNKLQSYPEIQTNDISGIERNVIFEESLEFATGIDSISITNAGYGYTSAPTVIIDGDGSGATATAIVQDGRIVNIKLNSPGADYTRAAVSFVGGGGYNAEAEIRLASDYGKIRAFYYNADGKKINISDNAGQINYKTGYVQIYPIKINSVTENDVLDVDTFTISAPAAEEIISPLRNRILYIDPNDPRSIQIEIVAES